MKVLFYEELKVVMKNLKSLSVQGVSIHFEKSKSKKNLATDDSKEELSSQPVECKEDQFGYCHLPVLLS